ncbi:MAG: exodeoxyribonuclease VII large subunit [Saprospiraceae bacterium]|nr:exodeoxyribonuclease VII large subunit [Saprospiraceae bacterium]
METYTLYNLNEYLKRVIALNFPEPIWISCEIAQVKNSRGNYYLELVQQDENHEVIAQSSAALWYKNFLFLKSKLGDLLPSLLKDGVQVKIKVSLEFSEKYGLKLIIEDIDPTYTLGQMELSRQKILERLKQSGKAEDNIGLSMPLVVQHIAVISSENAAGYKDFVAHLEENKYGYAYRHTLFTSALQGANTEKEIVAALQMISENAKDFDLVVIIRGGGSKLDLAYFDNFNIGYAIATFKIPVVTGIGHEIDLSIADLVAHLSLKTPTAVADFIVERSLHFESMVEEMSTQANRLCQQKIKEATLLLEASFMHLTSRPGEIVRNARLEISQNWNAVLSSSEFRLKTQKHALANFEAVLMMSHPSHILKRGFTLIKGKEGYITRKNQLSDDPEIEIEFFDGTYVVSKSNK